MSIKVPGTNIDFVVTPLYFLAEFDVYDREEGFGEYLNKFDPNDPGDLHKLFNEYLFTGKLVERYEVVHKVEILKVLADALSDKNYDFEGLVSGVYDSEDGFSLPSKWKIENPRLFFIAAYKAVYERWGKMLIDSGVTVIKPEVFE